MASRCRISPHSATRKTINHALANRASHGTDSCPLNSRSEAISDWAFCVAKSSSSANASANASSAASASAAGCPSRDITASGNHARSNSPARELESKVLKRTLAGKLLRVVSRQSAISLAKLRRRVRDFFAKDAPVKVLSPRLSLYKSALKFIRKAVAHPRRKRADTISQTALTARHPRFSRIAGCNLTHFRQSR